MKILGHRGVPVLLKENTIPSLLKAFEFGADGIETDLRITKDGKIVLIHDETLKSFCGEDIRVKDLELNDLSKFSSDGLKVPTLEEFLEVVPKYKCLNLEIKDYEAGELAVELSKSYEGEIIYSSFNHKLIDQLKQTYPNLKFGYLFGKEHSNMSDEEFFNLFTLNTYSAHLPITAYEQKPEIIEKIVEKLKNMGIKIVFWTVNSKEAIKSIQHYIDYLITDDVRIFSGF
ncbi:MAG: glycerophosphodiester phosphodiesterase family protein [Fervidobacterium sp.]